MHNGVLGFQSNGALKGVVTFFTFEIFVSTKTLTLVYSQHFCMVAVKTEYLFTMSRFCIS